MANLFSTRLLIKLSEGQKMVLIQLDIQMERTKLAQSLNVRAKTVKLLEENKGENLSELGLCKVF